MFSESMIHQRFLRKETALLTIVRMYISNNQKQELIEVGQKGISNNLEGCRRGGMMEAPATTVAAAKVTRGIGPRIDNRKKLRK